MAEEAPVPELAEQQPGDLQPAAEQAAPDAAAEQAAPAAEDAAAAAAEGGAGKRGREEEEGLDGEEPEAKKHAGLDGQPNEAAADGAAAAAEAAGNPEQPAAADAAPGEAPAAAANGSDNPGHGQPAAAGEGGEQQAAAGTDNPGHAGHPEHTGPPPVKEGLGTTANEDGSMSELIAVSKHLVGKLIGKAGTTIQQLQQSTQTNIQIDQNENPDHPESKIVTLRGSEENVARAKECIKQLLEEALAPQEGEVEEKISCPAGIVGRIIGRGGETIRSLQQSSGSHIMVDQNYPEGQDRMVIIKGQRDNVTRAAAMISELIAGEPGSASAIIAKHSIGVNLTVSCPKSMVGRVIGKGGDTIKGLQRKYHTSIQVGSQVEQQGDPMTITITGPKGSAEMCKQEITALINDPYPLGPGPRAMGYPRGPPGFGPPYGGPPPPYGAPYGAPYGSPYGAPYGAPYPSPGGYGGYGGPGAAPYGGGAGGYGAGGYGQGGYGGAAAGGYGAGGYGGQAGGYGGEAGSGGAASGGAGGYGGAAPAAAPAASGSVWQAMNDDQGRTYYYNSQTGVSQWEKPADMP